MRVINSNVADAAPSGIREIVNMVVGRPDVYRLEIGQPSFGPPDHVLRALSDWAGTRHGYTASGGTDKLRSLITQKLEAVNGVRASVEQITVTVGAMGGIAGLFLALARPSSRILIPDVAWPNYELLARSLGLGVDYYRAGLDRGFVPDLEEVKRAITPRTAIVVLNSPSNPGGVVLDPSIVAGFVELTNDKRVWLVSDETYDQLVLEGTHQSAYALPHAGHVVSVFSFSKTYAMPGYRVGYVIGSRDVSRQLNKLQEALVSCAPSLGQLAAEIALAGDQSFIEESLRTYRRRRDILLQTLGPRFITYSPSGAFYAMVDVSSSGQGSREFALRLLEEERVAVAPGDAFGNAHGCVRICFAAEESVLIEGALGVKRYLERRAGLWPLVSSPAY